MNTIAIISIAAMSLAGFFFCVWMTRHDNIDIR